MTTTTSTYLAVSQNLTRYQTMTADQPAVKTASEYYAANIGKVTSIQDFVGNYRLLSYALDAYGLGDQVNSTALVTQVLQGGVTDPKALANTLSNPNWAKFAAAFDFVGQGAASISTASAVQTTTSDYVEQQLESDQGAQDQGVQLALYFQRVAPTVSTGMGIMGDVNLLDVVQTIFGLPPETAGTNIDAEAAIISQLVPTSTLQDPTKLQQLTERFTAMYDSTYGPGGTGASTPLTISNDGASTAPVSAATTILTNLINANGASSGSLTSAAASFSGDLISSLQGLTLGG